MTQRKDKKTMKTIMMEQTALNFDVKTIAVDPLSYVFLSTLKELSYNKTFNEAIHKDRTGKNIGTNEYIFELLNSSKSLFTLIKEQINLKELEEVNKEHPLVDYYQIAEFGSEFFRKCSYTLKRSDFFSTVASDENIIFEYGDGNELIDILEVSTQRNFEVNEYFYRLLDFKLKYTETNRIEMEKFFFTFLCELPSTVSQLIDSCAAFTDLEKLVSHQINAIHYDLGNKLIAQFTKTFLKYTGKILYTKKKEVKKISDEFVGVTYANL